MWVLYILGAIIFFVLIRHMNKTYFILALAKRIRTVDGSDLNEKVAVIKGKTIFGNNFDLLDNSPETLFRFLRDCRIIAKGKSYLFYFIHAPVYNVTNADDAEEIMQSQQLISKSIIYELLRKFLGDGLLISTNEKWHFRRKMLTPAFHFNVLISFLEIFKQETAKQLEYLENHVNEIIKLDFVISEFTLNTICETALGVKLAELDDGHRYRDSIHAFERVNTYRACNPLLYYEWIFLFKRKEYKVQEESVRQAHEFSSKIIEHKRQEYKQRKLQQGNIEADDLGKKRRWAMLDTLLDAEANGLIDHVGICEEVDTFMFEGYDTTAMALRFALLNLAWRKDVQERCYQELQQFDNLQDLCVFDFNKLEYLECVLKETLRLYPSVPFLARQNMHETQVNGLILPPLTQINLHIFDIMRDERHFPDPNKFDPDRFLPENTTHRHPFAYVPFSAGPRNCIGQKFALLELKVFLANIIKNFHILPVTRLDDIVFKNGIVLRANPTIEIKLTKRL